MIIFTRILVIGMIVLMTGTVILASSQGWWWYTFSSPNVMKTNKEFNQQYRSSGGAYYSRSGMRNQNQRSFRSGTRGGRGK